VNAADHVRAAGVADVFVAPVEELEGRVLFAAHYEVTNLVSDGAVPASHTDANLKNGWGLARGFTGPWVVASNGADVATSYNGSGVAQPPGAALVVHIPGGAPTGAVFNGDNQFFITRDGHTRPARYLFATEAGRIVGFNAGVSADDAVTAVDRSPQGAIYKGLTLATMNGHDFLYATDFHNGHVDVFNQNFQKVNLSGKFGDSKLPKGYAPYGVQYLNGKIYVTFAKQDADAMDEVPGAGLGFVDVFTKTGKLFRRLGAMGTLNAPWGLAMAPADFGPFSGDILVGNFGDGRISAFTPGGHFQGLLRDASNDPVEIDELWGIAFGNGDAAGPKNRLFFAAGPNEEENGLFGSIRAVS
jgi:uncharacterized protein (TIGR03118 family)